MSVQAVGFRAYTEAMANFAKAERATRMQPSTQPQADRSGFGETLQNSLGKVNDLQTEKGKMITSFAAGENQNVHELMISLQKASLAVNLTSAVRNKVMEAYKELSRMQF